MIITGDKLKYFYVNKYIAGPVSRKKYFLCYDFEKKALWFRVHKVATRTILHHFQNSRDEKQFIYAGESGYMPSLFDDFFKFAFVRNPESRLISAWKDKVLKSNYWNLEDSLYQKLRNLDYFIDWMKDIDVSTYYDEHLRDQNSEIDLTNIDFLGRFENFENDFGFIREKLDLAKLTDVRKNKSADYDFTVTDKNKQDIREIYKKDFQIFYPHEL